MLIRLTHTTELSYTDVIRESVMELRVCPMQAANQARLGFELAIGPAAQVHGYFDWLDNHVHAFAINPPHDRIEIAATSIVRTDPADGEDADVADVLAGRGGGGEGGGGGGAAEYELYDFLRVEPELAAAEEVRDLVGQVAAKPGEPAGDVVARAMALVRDSFVYEQGVTSSHTGVVDFLRQRRGVCQDFTHAFLALVRSLDVPARYVSGILHADTDHADLLGATQTHAWAEVYLDGVWVGLDPTNQCVAGERFVKVAVGRGYGDVPPNRGVYRGNAEESIAVDVQTQRLSSVPVELSAEQFRRLQVSVPTEAALATAHDGPQQQQQQQQQTGLPLRVA